VDWLNFDHNLIGTESFVNDSRFTLVFLPVFKRFLLTTSDLLQHGAEEHRYAAKFDGNETGWSPRID
jgi:hypothetical protein